MTESASRLREAYDGGAANWASGPAAIYRRMADALIASVRVPLVGRRVLDIGAGTGATTAALLAAGAEVVGADLFFAMLRVDREDRPPAVNADAASMPFAPESFDASAFAFVLSHLDAPLDALVEAARVTRQGGAVLSVGYDARWSFAAKEVIEATLMTFGFERPEWYDRMKRETEPLSAFPDRLAALAPEKPVSSTSLSTRSARTCRCARPKPSSPGGSRCRCTSRSSRGSMTQPARA
ncbi:MAG TPA: class I SAM-dependent methyltransferase [Acidimicrobiia bacterium]|nr:class I SAM-dependent methyltransferase [Acidimicrobiia bacterium]